MQHIFVKSRKILSLKKSGAQPSQTTHSQMPNKKSQFHAVINRALSVMVARFSLLMFNFNFYLYISTYGFAINISQSRMFSL